MVRASREVARRAKATEFRLLKASLRPDTNLSVVVLIFLVAEVITQVSNPS